MGVLAPFARLAAGDAAQSARATLLRWGLEGPRRLTTAHHRLCESQSHQGRGGWANKKVCRESLRLSSSEGARYFTVTCEHSCDEAIAGSGNWHSVL